MVQDTDIVGITGGECGGESEIAAGDHQILGHSIDGVPQYQIAAEQAEDAFDMVEADAAAQLADAELPRAGPLLVLDAGRLAAAHPYRVRESLRLLWHREGWPTNQMSFDHWTRLVAVVRGDLTAADFPGGVTARHAGRVVQLGLRP